MSVHVSMIANIFVPTPMDLIYVAVSMDISSLSLTMLLAMVTVML